MHQLFLAQTLRRPFRPPRTSRRTGKGDGGEPLISTAAGNGCEYVQGSFTDIRDREVRGQVRFLTGKASGHVFLLTNFHDFPI